ncbi:hypothetical protein [Ascidiimonas sp. W6]|uniref:hypothetical protein n=1 Tax=Ascidiimonas meishanensis TaxID=3128903 RepID=UPI0030EE784C
MNREEKQLKSWIKEAGLESPSNDFEKNFMARLEEEAAYVSNSKPLISKSTWVLIFLGSAFLLGVAYFGSEDTYLSTNFFDRILLPLEAVSLEITNFTIPKSAIYGILFFVIMLFVQILVIRNQYQNHYQNK